MVEWLRPQALTQSVIHAILINTVSCSYLKEPASTHVTLIDQWLKTGQPVLTNRGVHLMHFFMLNSIEYEILTPHKIKMLKNIDFSCLRGLWCCIYPANNWHFNNYEQDKFHAQLSWVWKKFYNLGADLGHCLIVFFFSRNEMPVMPKDIMILYNMKLYE